MIIFVDFHVFLEILQNWTLQIKNFYLLLRTSMTTCQKCEESLPLAWFRIWDKKSIFSFGLTSLIHDLKEFMETSFVYKNH